MKILKFFVFIFALVVCLPMLAVAEDKIDIMGCKRLPNKDGYHRDFVWKPTAEHNRYAVVLFPKRFTGKVKLVTSHRYNGQKIKSLTFKASGIKPPNLPPGGEYLDRPTWREYTYSGSDYQRHYRRILIKASLKDGTCISFAIPHPGLRYD